MRRIGIGAVVGSIFGMVLSSREEVFGDQVTANISRFLEHYTTPSPQVFPWGDGVVPQEADAFTQCARFRVIAAAAP